MRMKNINDIRKHTDVSTPKHAETGGQRDAFINGSKDQEIPRKTRGSRMRHSSAQQRLLTSSQLFEAQAKKNPNAPAVLFPSTGPGNAASDRLTYRELNDKANQLSHYLMKLGVGQI